MDKELLGICAAVLILCVPTMLESWLTHREKMARINRANEIYGKGDDNDETTG